MEHAVEKEGVPPDELTAAGQRIETLLDASSAHGVVARERAEELVRIVADLYGAGLEHLLDLLYDAGRLDPEFLEALAADPLISGLLLVHGLHPYDVTTRVQKALDDVRPYLGSHGGDVELLGISEQGVVTLRLLGSCDGCPSSAVTLKLAVEGAVEAAAPEVTGIEVETPADDPSAAATVIPVSALRVRIGELAAEESAAGWEPVPELATLAAGEVRGCLVAGRPVLAARVGSDLYAYRDSCPRCTGGLADAVLERRLGGRAGDAVLRCPGCNAHYDVRHAGAGLDGGEERLEPLPLLVRDGMVSVCIPRPVSA
jgi:Fe-S cluster biogenesis protein NfuA/nitrite reductase/ring-hydroxylating ferredoxin subunit